jgi:hypothetical protein
VLVPGLGDLTSKIFGRKVISVPRAHRLARSNALVDTKDGKLTGAEVDAVIEGALAVNTANNEARRVAHRLSRIATLAELGHSHFYTPLPRIRSLGFRDRFSQMPCLTEHL